jgi:hypothetical protein
VIFYSAFQAIVFLALDAEVFTLILNTVKHESVIAIRSGTPYYIELAI